MKLKYREGFDELHIKKDKTKLTLSNDEVWEIIDFWSVDICLSCGQRKPLFGKRICYLCIKDQCNEGWPPLYNYGIPPKPIPINEQIEALRKMRGLTRREVGEQTELFSQFSKIEKGKLVPEFWQLDLIARALNANLIIALEPK